MASETAVKPPVATGGTVTQQSVVTNAEVINYIVSFAYTPGKPTTVNIVPLPGSPDVGVKPGVSLPYTPPLPKAQVVSFGIEVVGSISSVDPPTIDSKINLA